MDANSDTFHSRDFCGYVYFQTFVFLVKKAEEVQSTMNVGDLDGTPIADPPHTAAAAPVAYEQGAGSTMQDSSSGNQQIVFGYSAEDSEPEGKDGQEYEDSDEPQQSNAEKGSTSLEQPHAQQPGNLPESNNFQPLMPNVPLMQPPTLLVAPEAFPPGPPPFGMGMPSGFGYNQPPHPWGGMPGFPPQFPPGFMQNPGYPYYPPMGMPGPGPGMPGMGMPGQAMPGPGMPGQGNFFPPPPPPPPPPPQSDSGPRPFVRPPHNEFGNAGPGMGDFRPRFPSEAGGNPNMGPSGPPGPPMGMPGGPNIGSNVPPLMGPTPNAPHIGPNGPPQIGAGGPPLLGPGGPSLLGPRPLMGPGGPPPPPLMGPGGPNQMGSGGPPMGPGGPPMGPGGPQMGPGGPNMRPSGPQMGPGGPPMHPPQSGPPPMGPRGPNAPFMSNDFCRAPGPFPEEFGPRFPPRGPFNQFSPRPPPLLDDDSNKFGSDFKEGHRMEEDDYEPEEEYELDDYGNRIQPENNRFEKYDPEEDADSFSQKQNREFPANPGNVKRLNADGSWGDEGPMGGPPIGRDAPRLDNFGNNGRRQESFSSEGCGQDSFGRGQDNFGRGGRDSIGCGQDSFGRGQDNFGRGQDNFGRGQDNFGRSQDNFGQNRDNFGNDGRASE